MTSKLERVKSLMEQSFFDEDGWFNATKDRERYIKYLEWVNEAWRKDCEELRTENMCLRDEITHLIEEAAEEDL